MENNIPKCYTKEEWEKVKKQFDTDFKRYNKHIKSFRELINEILDGETEGTFVRKTELRYNMFSRIRTQVDKENPPQRNTLMSIAVGYKLDYQITSALLKSIGVEFILSKQYSELQKEDKESWQAFLRRIHKVIHYESSLRHTFTTRMCEAGVNIKAMQDILGHADAETTMDIYAEATKDLKRAELINFEDYFNTQKLAQTGIA